MLIDLHAHQLTKEMFNQHPHWGPFWDQGTLRVGDWSLGTKVDYAPSLDQYYEESFSPEVRAESFRKAGIDKVVLSLPFHMVSYHTEPDYAIRYARTVNDSLAAYRASNPGLFNFWAHIPAQDPKAAAAELERAVTQLGAAGVSMGGANFGGKEVSDPAFRPLWEKASELGVLIFVHGYNQSVNWGKDAMKDPYDTTSIIGMNHDETLFFWHLVNGGVLDDFPQLKVYITHGGGFIPYQLWRFNETNKTMAPDSKNKKDVIEYASNFYYDLDVHHPAMRRAVTEVVGVDHLLYGDNFSGSDSHSGDLTDGFGLGDEDREKIRSGNALQLLKNIV
ncbi:amidohydrolase family protein [Streptomyces phaeochromogenes]|uniref:amidohydrolase family protein n=1 Tax=Streptomyces phaeochromogenes TaxID=1923 RepID=UPI002DDACEB3|nr:amidohydrolase family protein [Streptomyces phaeochromogenes]WRZ34607.1 amidohydrolase family protein [Streptomyces phaeochromogenes]